MMRRPASILAVLAAMLIAPGPARADPRGVSVPPGPVTPEMLQARKAHAARNMAVWLPRLLGTYRYEGIAYIPGTNFPPVQVAGTGECGAVGLGPGTGCLIVLNGIQELIVIDRLWH